MREFNSFAYCSFPTSVEFNLRSRCFFLGGGVGQHTTLFGVYRTTERPEAEGTLTDACRVK